MNEIASKIIKEFQFQYKYDYRSHSDSLQFYAVVNL